MKKIKIISLLIVGILVAVAGNSIAQAASNHQDTPFAFVFGDNEYTPNRDKLNYTSAYMKATSIGGGNAYSARVTLANYTVVGPATAISLNRDTFLINYAGEDYGLPVSVRIKGSATGSSVFAASGVWSPDSVR